jgi:histidinol-phosphate phosphatase family protein
MPSKVAFLDRDGTIIEERNFIESPDEIRFLPGSVQAIQMLRESGYKIVVISNQSGIGRGILTEKMVREVNDLFIRRLKEKDAPVDGLYFCPHHPDANCECRKPETGMVQKAAEELKLDLKNTVVIGDKSIDVKLGKNIGAKTILVVTGYGKSEVNKLADQNDKPDFVADTLLDAANWIKRMNT